MLNHDSKMAGHPGISKTSQKIKQTCFWHKLDEDVNLYVRSCTECNTFKKPSKKAKAPLMSYHAGAPAERVHLDILGPFTPTKSGNRYILMLICQFTKWIEAYPLPDQTAESVARALIDNFISRFGCPLQIHTDQGANFTSCLFQAVCNILDIVKTRTTPYRPCSNGQIERYNRTLLGVMRCHLKGKVSEWDTDLPILTAAIRALPNRNTHVTPNLMMLGREVHQPITLMFETQANETKGEEPHAYVQNLKERMQRVHTLVRENIGEAQTYQKRNYDLKQNYSPFECGDIVYKLNKSSRACHSRKLQAIWLGPLLVMKPLSPVLYTRNQKRTGRCTRGDHDVWSAP